MIHPRPDYNDRIQDAATDKAELLPEGSIPIAQDEPVLLLRAGDNNFLQVADFYLSLLRNDAHISAEEVARVEAHIRTAQGWQDFNPVSTPQFPAPAEAKK